MSDQYNGDSKVPATFHPDDPVSFKERRSLADVDPAFKTKPRKVEPCQDGDCPDGKPFPNMRPNNAINPQAVHFHTTEGIWYPPAKELP